MIIETLPTDRYASEVVLYVRRFVRRRAAAREASPADLARYFGISDEEADALDLATAARDADPIAETARRISRRSSSGRSTVELPHDNTYLARSWEWLHARVKAETTFSGIIATDAATLLVLSQAIDAAEAISLTAKTHRPILITGASGTGKELLADAIYKCALAHKRIQPKFETIHVAGMNADLINDEIFGHIKGAYTSADQPRAGKIEAADGGVLFIDEVGDLPREAQLRLLRFLQDQRFSRNGDNKSKEAHVQIIAATWHDLGDDVKKGSFRLDLLHRLRALHLELPSLNHRMGFEWEVLDRMLQRHDHPAERRVRTTFRTAVMYHAWEGNLRELNFALREAMSNAGQSELQVEDLPASVRSSYATLSPMLRGAAEIDDALANPHHQEERLSVLIPRVAEAISQQTRVVPPNALRSIQDILAQTPDPTKGFAKMRDAVAKGVEALTELERLEAEQQEWGQIRAMVPTSKPWVDAHLATIETETKRLAQENLPERVFEEVLSTPIGRLYVDLSKTPLGMLDNGGVLRVLIPVLIGAVETVSPDLLKHLFRVVESGGLPALREALADIPTNDSETSTASPTREESRAAALNWGKREWNEQFKRCGKSVTALARQTGCSEPTIRKRLTKFGIKYHRATSSSESLPKAKPSKRPR